MGRSGDASLASRRVGVDLGYSFGFTGKCSLGISFLYGSAEVRWLSSIHFLYCYVELEGKEGMTTAFSCFLFD